MKPKLITIFMVIILTPLIFLTWFGDRLAKGEYEEIKARFNDLQLDRLENINARIEKLLNETERDFVLLIDDMQATSPEYLRRYAQKYHLIQQMFILESNAKLSFPKINPTATFNEVSFYERTKSIWDSRIHFYYRQDESGLTDQKYGWYTWFWGDGIHLIFWRWKRLSARIIGIEVDKKALLIDVIGQLPPPKKSNISNSRTTLMDAKSRVLHQWGMYQPDIHERPKARLAVKAPLNTWSLKFFAADNILDELDNRISSNIALSIVVITLSLIGLSYYFYKENSRELKEAFQKVSFVNKVSHELKTPLTNITMYAELLEKSVSEKDPKSLGSIKIIVSECQRLGRLIHNVLTVASKQKNGVQLTKSLGNIDLVIDSVMDIFRLPLKTRNITIEMDLERDQPVYFDPDIVRQILGNLINNVEKYASIGESLRIESRLEGDKTMIVVSDKGPGIPKEKIEDVFKLFVRLSDKLTDGVTGTGIGLSISRDLARLHGGDLGLKSDQKGTSFYLELKTPGDRDENTSR
ncbi:MAG TPA: HAMP domain-containing histidine kinase [Spirochaetes bacterium]|nr:HAMP domain-containing histidine kinase [Spirochaetota bacterium]